MKPVFSTLMAASLALLTPQIAEACFGNSPFTRQDVAFADVIFEGRVTGIVARPRYTELTFDVRDVVRGELKEDVVVIGWKPQYYPMNRDLTLEEFSFSHGETTRVAISTPQLADMFCEPKLVQGRLRDAVTGKIVKGESLQPVCDTTIGSLVSVAKENLPFVLSNSNRCGSTYLYSVEEYEKKLSYYKKLEPIEKMIADGLTPTREQLEELVGPGPVAFKGPTTRPEGLALDLFRDREEFFTPFLRKSSAWQGDLLDAGEALVRARAKNQSVAFDRDPELLQHFREDLRREILRLLDYMEKDPEFGNRLLEDD